MAVEILWIYNEERGPGVFDTHKISCRQEKQGKTPSNLLANGWLNKNKERW